MAEDNAKVQYCPLSLSGALLQGDQGLQDFVSKHHVRLQALKDTREVFEILLAPLLGVGPEHFTLLVVQGEEVRYYDSLQNQREACKDNVEAILRMMDLEQSLLERFNESRQSGNTCGAMVCHYMEEEVRAWPGEGRGHQAVRVLDGKHA